ncbi:MAG: Nudix family hydrolase [Halofilum sp. (in: g-proteobacteria)]|nr:Nudix family hydrolase [Halofilum sp. (in: g-proteobacteria)]
MRTVTDEMHVAVAVLQRADGRILVAERPSWRHQGGGLEFPGGKIDPGEAVEAALARELREELGVTLMHAESLIRVRHRYPDRGVVLHTLLVRDWAGEPHGLEGQPLAWKNPQDLDPERFPAANRPIVAALALPDCCLVTPSRPESDRARVIAGIDSAIRGGIEMVQLRTPGWSEPVRAELVGAACELVQSAGRRVRLVVNADNPDLLQRFPALSGLHLGAQAASAWDRRMIAPDRMLSCACHDAAELAHAERLGADIALVGHVRATPCHAQQEPLAWDGLEALTAGTALPVYAIGGLAADDVAEARRHGAVGIAGIRGLWPAD